MKIAVIGAGISGLGAAYLLHRHHDITLYEREEYLGGHSRTKIARYDEVEIPVDTGFIVFNYRNYPHLSGLFKHLHVPVKKSDMSFAATVQNNSIEWGARSVNAVFGQRSNLFRPAFWAMIRDIFRFNREAVKLLETKEDITLGALLDRLKMGEWFRQYFLLPIGGAIWSTPLQAMLEFPAYTFVEFFHKHGLLTINDQPQWYTVEGGSREYVKRLAQPFAEQALTNCAAARITRHGGKVQVKDVQGREQEYDQLVLACHAPEALALLEDVSEQERKVLEAFRTQPNRVVLHKDASQMPMRKSCWASWVYRREEHSPEDVLTVTYWMNRLQNIDNRYPLFVTLNPVTPIAEELIIDEGVLHHPVYSQEAVKGQKEMKELQGQRATWFCGAYLRYGFHEDGLGSAVDVAKALGAEVPWED